MPTVNSLKEVIEEIRAQLKVLRVDGDRRKAIKTMAKIIAAISSTSARTELANNQEIMNEIHENTRSMIPQVRVYAAIIHELLRSFEREDPNFAWFQRIAKDERAIVPEVLAIFKDWINSELLIWLLRNETDGLVKTKIVGILGDFKIQSLKDILVSLLNDNDILVRKEVILLLSKKFGDSARDYLLQSLNDKDGYVAEAAAKELAKVGSIEVVQPLLTFLKKMDRDLKDEILELLEKSGVELKNNELDELIPADERYLLVEDPYVDKLRSFEIIHNTIIKHKTHIHKYLYGLIKYHIDSEDVEKIEALLKEFQTKLREFVDIVSDKGIYNFEEDAWNSLLEKTAQPYGTIGDIIDIDKLTYKIASMLGCERDAFLEGINILMKRYYEGNLSDELIKDLEDEFRDIELIHNAILLHWVKIHNDLKELVLENELSSESVEEIMKLLREFLEKLKEYAKEASRRGFSDFGEEEWFLWIKKTFQPYAKIGNIIDIEKFTHSIARMLGSEKDAFLEGVLQSLPYVNY